MGPYNPYSDAAVVTKTPTGNVMVGIPVAPVAAYPYQTVPNPYYHQPPAAFYPTSEPVTGVPVGKGEKESAPVPPPFYYGPPADWQPPAMMQPPPVYSPPEAPPAVTQEYAPKAEVTAAFTNGDRTTTDGFYSGPAEEVTHLNYHSNYLSSLQGLNRYPNLLRLTLAWNDLTSLQGIEGCRYLRWIDAAGNHLRDLSGLQNVPSLEWLDLSNSDIRNFDGVGQCQGVQWLCMHHNYVSDFRAAGNLTKMQFLDVSDNEVKGVQGLERCFSLRELNLANNPMCEGNVPANVASVKALAELPCLSILNITDTFYDPEEADIVQHFRSRKPDCEVVTTEARAKQLGHNVYWKAGRGGGGGGGGSRGGGKD
eukprot:Hpha_TRINITY_DN16141_c0_g1::TRINITY_DN16141_c0_g1_i1::g.6009::m.6009